PDRGQAPRRSCALEAPQRRLAEEPRRAGRASVTRKSVEAGQPRAITRRRGFHWHPHRPFVAPLGVRATLRFLNLAADRKGLWANPCPGESGSFASFWDVGGAAS